MIPTMTHHSDIVSNLYHLNLDLFIAFDILSGICWHSIWQSISLSGIYSDILYMLSGIYSYSLSGNHSSILSDMSCNLSGILSDDILAFCMAFFYLAFCLASSLAWVRVQAHSTASQACDMAVGSRPTPQHPELGVPRLLHSEGGRNKEEGGIYRDPHLAGEEQRINQPDSQTIAGYFHSSVAFVGSVHHFGWSRHFWDIPGI